jgi:uncharacterized radical SAM protein YgiQ
MSQREMEELGWDQLDILLVTGDAYVDHPSFGAALLGRWLCSHGWRVGIVAQPDWREEETLTAMGRPRLFVGVTAGALDSMLAHYTAFRKKRSDDAYTPGGKAGARPNRACVVYVNLARRAFPGLPVVLGGVEASLRRLSHFDFWSDSLRRSVLLDSKADLLLYGMAERGILETAQRLDQAQEGGQEYSPKLLAAIPGSVRAISREEAAVLASDEAVVVMPTHESMQKEPVKLMEATLALEKLMHSGSQQATQEAGGRTLLMEPPAEHLSTVELDALYDLPFGKNPHPAYTETIPAAGMIKASITSHRGCAGGCSFCALALHQGRGIRSRSRKSILREAGRLAASPGFDGTISDVGGPSANMWGAYCAADPSRCARSSCLTPKLCPHFKADQKRIIDLLRSVKKVPGVKGVRVASGLRPDLALKDETSLRAFVAEFVGGQLKVAPEHTEDQVLRLMRKPSFDLFERFLTLFEKKSKGCSKEQYLIPYLMSAHPGSTKEDMHRLVTWLRNRGWKPQQVQCFIPLPGTVAAAMYYSGIDAEGKTISVARTDAQRLEQHRILMPMGDADPRVGRREKNKRSNEVKKGRRLPSRQR